MVSQTSRPSRQERPDFTSTSTYTLDNAAYLMWNIVSIGGKFCSPLVCHQGYLAFISFPFPGTCFSTMLGLNKRPPTLLHKSCSIDLQQQYFLKECVYFLFLSPFLKIVLYASNNPVLFLKDSLPPLSAPVQILGRYLVYSLSFMVFALRSGWKSVKIWSTHPA